MGKLATNLTSIHREDFVCSTGTIWGPYGAPDDTKEVDDNVARELDKYPSVWEVQLAWPDNHLKQHELLGIDDGSGGLSGGYPVEINGYDDQNRATGYNAGGIHYDIIYGPNGIDEVVGNNKTLLCHYDQEGRFIKAEVIN